MCDSPPSDAEVFAAALALPAAERATYLRRACGEAAGRLTRVEILLRAHESAGGFLEAAPRGAQAWRLTGAGHEEIPGERISRYKLVEKIGEGGCGTVWLAAQEEPVRRTVALKVIRLGMDTASVIARFEGERQALALMDHPNIARVFDAGATATGRPFFVMELVRGTKLTAYCDEQRLSTNARLRLFTQVCQAVQHAHQKGVIHRDLKPSNILVAVHDGVPVPKVIDFGIAKATQGRLTDQTVFTAVEQFIGTPAYMSPEQAELSGHDVDTRSDIYSLGVLLYELLAGIPPFDPAELARAGFDELRRQIREVEPPRPSARLRTLAGDTLATTAAHHATEPPRLIHGLSGDLDWIVMRCLEKDRTRRYETATGLADDIRRHLDHEPVIARPPGGFYRLGKFARRHRLACGAASAVLAAGVIGAGGIAWALFREKAAHARAVAAEQAALAAGAKSDQIARFLRTMLESVEPAVARGRDTRLLREILENTARRIGRELPNSPEVEAELRTTLGWVYQAIGDYDKAEVMYRAVESLQRRVLGQDHPEVATALRRTALVRKARGDLAGAEALEREVLAMRRRLHGAEHRDVAFSLHCLAAFRTARGDRTEAEHLQHEALAMQRRLLGGDHPTVAASLVALAGHARARGELAEAETLTRDALAIERKQPLNRWSKLPATLTALAAIATDRNDLDGAETLQREILALQRQQFGKIHPDVATALTVLAGTRSKRGDHAEAESLTREALALRRQLYGEGHPSIAFSLQQLADFRQAQGDRLEADTLRAEARAIRRQAPAHDPHAGPDTASIPEVFPNEPGDPAAWVTPPGPLPH